MLLASAALVVVDLHDETSSMPPPGTRHRSSNSRRGSPTARRRQRADDRLASTLRVANSTPFPVGTPFVMFTDGLVERNDRPFDVGIDQIVEVLAKLPSRLTPSEVTDAIVDSLLAGAAARTTSPSSPPTTGLTPCPVRPVLDESELWTLPRTPEFRQRAELAWLGEKPSPRRPAILGISMLGRSGTGEIDLWPAHRTVRPASSTAQAARPTWRRHPGG